MAGWTFNRQAKQKRPLEVRCSKAVRPVAKTEAADPDESLTLGALLGNAPTPVAAPRLVSSQQAQLLRLVELEIIPRLMLLHRPPMHPQPVAPRVHITVEQVRELTTLAVEGTPESTEAFARRLLDDGASHEQVFLDLLAPSARWMGELWEEDVYSFSQVTIGLWRLQRVLHELAGPAGAMVRAGGDSRRALLAAVPGSQHTFGVVMAAEFFGRAGWEVACQPGVGWHELKSRVGGEWFDVFGLSISASDSIAQLASAILDIRKAAANPQLFVMVGGPMAALMPDLARRCGADAMASDAPTAIATANASLCRSVKTA